MPTGAVGGPRPARSSVRRLIQALGRPAMRRRLVVMADQAASALSNVLVAVLVARASGPVAFGAFSLAMVASQLAVGATRSLVGEPLLSLYSAGGASERRRLAADLQGTTLLLAAVTSAVLVVVALTIGGVSGSALLALAVVLPLVLVQDTWRFLFIVDRPGWALVVDLVWLAAVAVAVPLAPDTADVGWYVVAWGATGGLGALAGVALMRAWRSVPAESAEAPAASEAARASAAARSPVGQRPHPWRWLVEHRATGGRFLGEFVTARASSDLVLTALGVVAGLAALGAAKASLVYYGLLNTLHAGIYLAVVPEGARRRGRPAELRRVLVVTSAGLVAVAAAWMVVGLLLPDAWGGHLFGATWGRAEEIMLPMGLAMVLGGVHSGALLGLRSLADARRSLRARLWSTPWMVAGPLAGALVAGAPGFAWGFAAARGVAAVIWWWTFRQALDEVDPAAAGDGDDDGDDGDGAGGVERAGLSELPGRLVDGGSTVREGVMI